MEDEWGHLPFLVFYLLAGFAAAYLQYFPDPHSSVPVVGASGAIAGVLGGYLLMFPRARVDVLFIFIVFFKVFPIPAWVTLLAWFFIQLAAGFSTPAGGDGVAYWAHVGGFAAGIVLCLPMWLHRGGTQYWRRNFGAPPHGAAQYKRVRTHVPHVRRR
jgi:membrane associated rhomboid family serine protease